jgi:hypothetical protein
MHSDVDSFAAVLLAGFLAIPYIVNTHIRARGIQRIFPIPITFMPECFPLSINYLDRTGEMLGVCVCVPR